MSVISVQPRPHERIGDQQRMSATVTTDDGAPRDLWFDVPATHVGDLVDDADPWVLATLHEAMMRGSTLRVHGRVSPSLLANLDEYQAAFAAWSARPRWPGSAVYQAIPIEVDELAERPRPNRAAVCAFSGGLDSSFTLARHVRGEAGHATREVGAAIMVAGFDIPRSEPEVFASAAARARRITDDLGVPLVEVATNLRDVDLPWPDTFAAAVMAVLSLFGGSYGAGLVATGRYWAWLDLPDDGSSPAWDWALGSDSFAAVHDGAAFDRPEKVAYLADWAAARRNVRVCWAGAHLDRNCGRCRKCIGTYLLFRCLDIPPDCFDDVPRDDELADLVSLRRPGWTIAFRYGVSLLATARERGVDEPWVGALERSLFKDRRLDDLERAGRAAKVAGARLAALRPANPLRR